MRHFHIFTVFNSLHWPYCRVYGADGWLRVQTMKW